MRSFSGIGLAWFLATVVAVTIAAAAVGSVRTVVTDVPTALGVSALAAIVQGESGLDSDAPDNASVLDEDTTTPTVASIVETATTDPQDVATTTSTTVPSPSEQVVLAQPQPERKETTKSLPQGSSPPSTAPVPSETSGTTTTTTKPDAPATTNTTTTTAQPPATVLPTTSTTTTTTTTTAPPTTTTTTAPPTTTTTTNPNPGLIVVPPKTTTTTTPFPSDVYTRIIDTEAGSLSVRVNEDSVLFRRAYPTNGWRFDLADGGPETVVARFSRITDRATRIRIVATAVDGILSVVIVRSN